MSRARDLPSPSFSAKTLAFLRKLKRNNDRTWFREHRDEYDTHVLAPMLAVIAALADDFPAFAPEMVADPKVSLFRPWRDTRFSDDKTPLKTHVAAGFPNRILGRMNGAGLYFEVEPRWVWIGGGIYAPDTSQLQALREHVAAHHRQLDKILKAPAFTRACGALKGDRLTRVPRGFDKAHPAADYLQQKQFLGFREERAEFATRPDFYKQLVATFTALAPLCRFLNEPLIEQRRVANRAHMLSD